MSWFCNINWYTVLTFALVIVTGFYAFFTYKILKESQRSREVLERQAAALEETNQLLIRQIEDVVGLGREIVRAAIQTALNNINYWKSAKIANLVNINALPSKIDLVPPDDRSALYHAARISSEGSVELSSAFDNLRLAQNELEILLKSGGRTFKFIEEHTEEALKFLNLAEIDIKKAQEHLQK